MKDQPIFVLVIGVVIGAVVALALAVVAFDLTKIPQFWAYVVLLLLLFVVAANVFLLFRGNKTLGATSADNNLQTLVDRVADDLQTESYSEVVRNNAVSIFKNIALYRARVFAAFLMLGLLGELVLVVQVAALIEQTDAIKIQTERISQQTTRDLFWQLHNDVEGSNRERAFRELLIIGRIEFNNFSFRGSDLSGMNIPNVLFSNSDFSNSKFVGTTMLGANITNTILRDSDFSRSILNGNFSGSNFASSNFQNSNLQGNFSGADFAGVDMTDATLEGAHFGNANLTGALVTIEQLAKTVRLQDVVGLSDEVLIEVKKLNPELLQHWNP